MKDARQALHSLIGVWPDHSAHGLPVEHFLAQAPTFHLSTTSHLTVTSKNSWILWRLRLRLLKRAF
jgi:hypothetical protein